MGRKTILKKELSSFLSALLIKLPDAKVIVFGSRAKNEHLLESDYDLLVISKKFSAMSFMDRMIYLLSFWKIRKDADIFGLTPNEAKERSKELGVIGTALREGVLL